MGILHTQPLSERAVNSVPWNSDTADDRAERLVYEVALGNHLHLHPRVVEHSNHLSAACLSYLRARSCNCSERFAHGMAKVASPIDLPFAGRVQNIAELYRVLSGHGLVREQQCAIWRVFNQMIAADLVGPLRRPDALDIANQAGFDTAFLEQWLQDALRYSSARRQREVRLEELDPRLDFMRMDWHPIRQLQNETRLTYSALHQRRRYWSLRLREAHKALGGTFSEVEHRLFSPLGRAYLPWMDTRRFFRANPQAPLVQQGMLAGIPFLTGVSGVGMHTHQFAKAMAIDDVVSTRLVAVAYLLPILQHSICEVWLSEMEQAPQALDSFSYQLVLPGDFPPYTCGMFSGQLQGLFHALG
ncbi:hypothetical protein D3C76_422370 [compost metagenome]